jgi:hypothetical protein
MKALVLVISAGVLLCSFSPGATAQKQTFPGPIQPRPGEGWTTEDARKIEPLPRYGYIEATIVALSVTDRGRFIVTLDNGTRWHQSEDKAQVRVDVGDNIKLEKSSIGSYTLITADGASTRVLRGR